MPSDRSAVSPAPGAAAPLPESLVSGKVDAAWRRYVARGIRNRILVAWTPDRTPRIAAFDPDTGRYETAARVGGWLVRASPDGKRLADITKQGFWVLTANGTVRKLDDQPRLPIWSADGRHLIDSNGALVAVDGTPGAPQPLPPEHGIEDVSRDGRWLVTQRDAVPATRGGQEQLYLARADGRDLRQLTNSGRNVFPRISPDGRWIVYTHVKDIRSREPSPEDGLWIVAADGKGRRQLLARADIDADMRACWSPDGKRLAVVLNREAGDRPRDASFIRCIQIIDTHGKIQRTIELPGVNWIPNPEWR